MEAIRSLRVAWRQRGWSLLARALMQRMGFWLALSAGWLSYLLVVFGILVEGHSYWPRMLWGATVVALGLWLLGWVSPTLYLVVAFFVGVVNLSYGYIAHNWRVGALEYRLMTTLDSPWRERSEFIATYVVGSKFFWFLTSYVLFGVFLGVLARRQARGIPFRVRVAAGLGLLLLVGLGYWKWPLLEDYPLLRFGTAAHRVYKDYRVILTRRPRIRRLMARMPETPCPSPFTKVVFVLGESANRDFMHLYGFDMPTTPFLDSLEGKVYFKAISPVNQTLTSVPVILTPAKVDEFDRFYNEPSVLSYLRKCGYQVFWLSNQLRYSPYTSTVSSIADEADVVRFIFYELGEEYAGGYDENLMRILYPEDIVPGKRQVFFFHLLGSHFDWKQRYPPEAALISNPQNNVDHYINSIAYTDRVLERIFRYFAEQEDPFLFVYTPDHGEFVAPKEVGHAFATSYQEEYRIPLVFWASVESPRLQRLQQLVQDRIVNTETMDLVLLYLVGQREDPGLSFRPWVLSLGPPRVRNYYELPYITYQERP